MGSEGEKVFQISEEKIAEWYQSLRKKYHESKKDSMCTTDEMRWFFKGNRQSIEDELSRLEKYFPDFDFSKLPGFYDETEGL